MSYTAMRQAFTKHFGIDVSEGVNIDDLDLWVGFEAGWCLAKTEGETK